MKIHVFSYNVWGLAMASKFLKQRMEALPSFLLEKATDSSADVNIICMQELFSRKDYKFLADSLDTVYPFSRFFPSGVVGSGLAIFSSRPLLNVAFKPYDFSGYHDKVTEGDYYAQKGMAFVMIQLDDNGSDKPLSIGIFNTHMQAEYNEQHPQYPNQRLLQTLDLRNFIREKGSAFGCDAIVLLGDLNMQSSDFCYKVLLDGGFLMDTGKDLGPTINAPDSTYRGIGGGGGFRPEKVDFIMYANLNHASSILTPITARISANEPIVDPMKNGKLYHLSDHYGLETIFSVASHGTSPISPSNTKESTDISSPIEPSKSTTSITVPVNTIIRSSLEMHLEDLTQNRQKSLRLKAPALAVILAGLLAMIISFSWTRSSGSGDNVIGPVLNTMGVLIVPVITLLLWNQIWKGMVTFTSEINIVTRYLDNHHHHHEDLDQDPCKRANSDSITKSAKTIQC